MNIKKILFSLLFLIFIFGWGENFDSLKDPEVRSVIDAYGRLVQITTMVRVARGETTVEFKEGKVVAYEEKK